MIPSQRQLVRAILSSEIPEGLKPGGQLAVAESLEVYRSSHLVRMAESLAETYPLVKKCLGEDFDDLAEKYIHQSPSSSYNLSDYGEGFVRFLSHSLPEHQYLGELARLEWIIKELFHKVPLPAQQGGSLAQVLKTATDFVLQFSDSMEIFHSKNSAYELWKSRCLTHFSGSLAKEQWILLYKLSDGVYLREITENHYGMIQLLRMGRSVEQAYAQFQKSMPEQELISLFQLFVQIPVIGSARATEVI